MNPTILHWQATLTKILSFYENWKPNFWIFFPLLYLFFIIINDLCYWGAMISAFPELVFGYPFAYYFKIQFPVAILGALFDSLSFFVTIYIIRKATISTNSNAFIGHLSIDLGIAVLATFWVLFVFSLSSWLIHEIVHEVQDQALQERQAAYAKRISNAIESPTENLRNIYFGLIMGLSAMLPTITHLGLAFRSYLLVKLNKASY